MKLGSGPQRVVITGAGGRVGRRLTVAFGEHGWEVTALLRSDLDIRIGREAMRPMLDDLRPTVVVNCAAWTDVGRCEQDPDGAWSVNADAVGALSAVCGQIGAHLVHLSTNYVFDGFAGRPYSEDDPTNPISAYGASKLAGERQAGPASTVVRLAWLFDAAGRSLVHDMIAEATTPGAVLRYVDDRWGSPTNLDLVAPLLVQLAADRPPGVLHLANRGVTTYFDVAEHMVARIGAPGVSVVAARSDAFDVGVPRPRFSALSSDRLESLGYEPTATWREAIDALLASVPDTQPSTAP